MSKISARIVQDSKSSSTGDRLTTFEIEFPRWILAETLTHKMLSKNTSSSRAIPIKKYISMIWDEPATPVYWGANQAGMTAKEEIKNTNLARLIWRSASKTMVGFVWALSKLGLHKQTANRLIETFTTVKMVISGTEWANFFYLRNHPDAQPEFQVLAKIMYDEYLKSIPNILKEGQWHLPYVGTEFNEDGSVSYYDTSNNENIDLETAKMVSASCCAQVSYRVLDTSVEKAIDIFRKLIESKPCHASPLEHAGTPISSMTNSRLPNNPATWEEGITHMRRDKSLWSANFKGFIQYRQTLQGHTKWDMEELK
jgi:thymidylate synthase ThyX